MYWSSIEISFHVVNTDMLNDAAGMKVFILLQLQELSWLRMAHTISAC